MYHPVIFTLYILLIIHLIYSKGEDFSTMKKRIFAVLLPVFVIPLAFVISIAFLKFMKTTHYTCIAYFCTGFLCPGCGGTRSLNHLLHGDILSSFRCNPSVPLAVVFAVLLYIEILTDAFGHKKEIIPRSKAFYFTMAGIISVFYVARNFISVLQPV